MSQPLAAHTTSLESLSPTSKHTPQTNAPKAIVIGAGFGGLAAALRLRARGYDVTIIDKQDQLGGRAYVHHRGGFVFDAGPTVITAPFLLEELFTLFNLGYINLKDRAIGEEFFHVICHRALYFSSFHKHQLEEFEDLQQLHGNADHWI